MPFSISFSIWTQVDDFISHEDNLDAKRVSSKLLVSVKIPFIGQINLFENLLVMDRNIWNVITMCKHVIKKK